MHFHFHAHMYSCNNHSSNSSKMWGKEEGVFFSKLCLVWRVNCSLFTFHLDQSTFHASVYILFLRVGGDVNAKSSQVPDVFIKEFPIAIHFYPIQMFSSFHLYRWTKGEKHQAWHWNLLLWGVPLFYLFLSDGQIKLAHCKTKN